jgi:hypothetical protein
VFSAFGQGNQLYQEIQQAKEEGASFSKKEVFSKGTTNDEVLNNFYNKEEVYFLKYNTSILQAEEQNVSIEIPMGETFLNMELMGVKNSFYDFNIVTGSGEVISPNTGNKHYRGIITDDENSLSAISFFEDDVMGVISTQTGDYNIVKYKEQYIMYRDLNLKHSLEFNCDTEDDSKFRGYNPDILLEKNKAKAAAASAQKCVKFYFETEYDIYQNKGSITGVENYVTALFNQVAILYQNESITTVISEIKVWDTTDPYTASSTGSLLNQFQSNISTFNGDLGQLLTFRSIGGGRAAGFSGLCNSNPDNSLSVSGVNPSVVNIPTYSWNVMVVTHEFGHLFGSRHTHACVWNGNSTAIDGCSGSTEGGCSLPGIPSGGGTIMSYCHTQSVGINFSLGFGPQPGNVIRNNVANASCLTICCLQDDIVTVNVNSGNSDYRQAINSITASNTIASGANAVYHAGNEVLLTSDFDALNGSVFRAHIEGCSGNFVLKQGNNEEEGEDIIVTKEETLNGLKLFPNPTKGVLNIKLKAGMLDNATIKVYSFNGAEVYSNTIQRKNVTNHELDLSKFKTGIYIVKVTDTNGITHVNKIIKE